MGTLPVAGAQKSAAIARANIFAGFSWGIFLMQPELIKTVREHSRRVGIAALSRRYG
jgi:hypothetical protein